MCAGSQVYEKWLWPLPAHLSYFLQETDVPAMMGVDFMARYSQVGGGARETSATGEMILVGVICSDGMNVFPLQLFSRVNLLSPHYVASAMWLSLCHCGCII